MGQDRIPKLLCRRHQAAISMKCAVDKPYILEHYGATSVGDIAVTNNDVLHVFAIKPNSGVATIDDEVGKLAAFGLRVAELFKTC